VATRNPGTTPTIDYTELARQVAPLVASLLVARLTGEVWPRTSARRDAPPGVSPRRWSKLAATIGRRAPGARFYTVEREDWDRYVGAAAPAANDAPTAATWSPAADLARQRLRATR
jgi:hypothetical protein